MTMTIDLDRIKREIPIETLIAQSFTVVGKGHILTTEEHDSLKIFTRNNSWTWYSQAGRDGRNLGGSVIDWYKHINRCSDGEAIRALHALLEGGALPPAARTAFPGKQPAAAWKSDRWQADARRRLEAAQVALWDDDNAAAAAGRAYLTERGIRPDMWVAFGLGVASAWNAKAGRHLPAIYLPWQNRQITAIQYRFLGVSKGDKTQDRFGQLKGGDRYLFGLQHCLDAEPGQLETLFVVEGELNAVCIFQAAHGLYPCDAVSFGPKDNLKAHNQDLIAKVAARYKRVIVWADEPEDALDALGTIPNALPLFSPPINGKKHDANDLLRVGLLDDVIYDAIRMAKDGQAQA